MTYFNKVIKITVLLVLNIFSSAYAQDNLNITDEFEQCMNLDDAPQRFACYEALSIKVQESDAETMNAHTRESSMITNSGENSDRNEQQRSRIESFGNEEEVQHMSPEARESETLSNYIDHEPRIIVRENGEDELQGRIKQVTFMNNQLREVILDGGQIWRQTVPKRYNLEEGARVKIYPSGWGTSFRLEMEGRAGFIQVRRVN